MIVFDLRNTRAVLNYVLCTLLEMFTVELRFALHETASNFLSRSKCVPLTGPDSGATREGARTKRGGEAWTGTH